MKRIPAFWIGGKGEGILGELVRLTVKQKQKQKKLKMRSRTKSVRFRRKGVESKQKNDLGGIVWKVH